MFATRQMMLGFPCAMFWGILGGYCYTLSGTTWDIHYLIFFASMGMVIFTMLAAYGLRRADLAEPDIGEGGYVDEETEPDLSGEVETDVGPRVKRLRERIEQRRKRRRGELE